MVKKIYIIIVYFGFVMFGGGFLIAFGQFVVFNGFGNFFEYVKADNAEIDYEIETRFTNIHYSFIVNNRLFESKETIANSFIKERDVQIDEVFYNKHFPSLNFVGNNQLRLRQANVSMFIMGFFFLFIFLIYRFADTDKWIGVYARGEYKSSRKP